MYPAPFFPPDEHTRAQDEIRRAGFIADPLIARLDAPFLGLNVAFAWPLPEVFRAAYERMREQLLALDPGVYVYPFAETHVTVATIVRFMDHPDPSPEDRARLLALVPGVAEALDGAAAGLAAFDIEIGAPVLVRAAAFLPILNPGGAVSRVRRLLAERLRDTAPDCPAIKLPNAVHSTILRFRQVPAEAPAFCARFEEVARTVRLGPTRIDELLVTTETRPYMLEGEIVHHTRLA
jgi:hypothetical protein